MNRTEFRNRIKKQAMVLFIISCSIFFAQPAVAQDDDYTIPEGKQREELQNRVRGLLKDRNWDELEKIVQELRTKKLRFPGGIWKLDLFYDGLAEPKKHTVPRDWDIFFTKLQEWKAAKPDSVTPLIALGRGYISYAWDARGGGYASTVTEEGWRLFRERLAKAREYLLETAMKMPDKDPEAYNALLTIARGQGWSRPDAAAWFHRAVLIGSDYHGTYFAMAVYLLPRWNGKPGDAERFVEEAAELCKEEGNAMYARIAWHLSTYVGINQFFEEYTFTWPRMKEGFQKLQKLYPKSRRNQTAFCMFAYLAQDYDTARELFAEIGDQWDQEVWRLKDGYLRCKELAESK